MKFWIYHYKEQMNWILRKILGLLVTHLVLPISDEFSD